MSLHCTKIARNVHIAAIVVLGAVLMHRVEAAPILNVCVDQTNPTMAMDARVARAAAKTQGYSVHEVKFIGHGKLPSDGFPISRFAKMAKSECQIIMGFPVDVDHPQLPPGVKATSAYASTGFVIVGLGTTVPKPLGDLPKKTQVGIAHLDTWAGTLFASHPNMVMNVYPHDADMLADLEQKKIDAGLAWQPFLEGYEHRHVGHAPFGFHIIDGKHMTWDLVALYAPDSEKYSSIFNKGVKALRDSGDLDKLVKPYFPPAPEAQKEADAQSTGSTSNSAAYVPADAGQLTKVAEKKSDKPKAPALFTKDQASKGRITYLQNCAMCHGPQLGGQVGGFPGPALKGEDFADPSYDFHISDIFNFVSKLMPAGTPGSLTNDQYTDIMAFILQQNGYPAGSVELTYKGAEKSKVPLLYYGK